ncbi:MAG: nucleotide exchange factor GrpE [Deltaproteobacteria bacterium]|nr:MAG: nucleotide exchange factor GrpE [Deltaproteobacteria bacterium]
MDRKEKEPAKREESARELDQEDLKKGVGHHQTQAEPADTAVEKEDFDPETAHRETLLKKYRELEVQLREALDQTLRVAADAENFKKRIEREKEDQTRYANEAFVRDLLPVIDNLERALEHSEAGPNQEGLVEGLQMTLRGFIDTLGKFGCTPVEAMNQAFDPNFHEAVSQEESSEHPANTVVRELQKGYMLKERLLRPAMVVVSKPPHQSAESVPEQSTGDTERADKTGTNIRIKRA